MKDNDQTAAAQQTVNVDRRRAIFKGLGKTAAVAGAATPLTSLAGASLRYVDTGGTNHQCTLSGHMSVMHSAIADSVPVCKGLLPSKYAYQPRAGSSDPATWNGSTKKAANWPNWPTMDVGGQTRAVIYNGVGTAYHPDTPFNTLFGSGVSTLIGYLISNGSDEGQWLAALLNAHKYYPGKFPHLKAEVIAHYNGPNKAKALELYATYVNKYTSV